MINVTVPNKCITAHVSQDNPKIDNSNIKVVKGDTGAVFTPFVDIESNLSWSNNGGLPNPPTRNIKGKDGEAATVTAITNTEIEAIMGGFKT